VTTPFLPLALSGAAATCVGVGLARFAFVPLFPALVQAGWETLEGFQAGLSWITILKRRETFRKAFHNFNIKKVAKLNDADVERLMLDAGIIRNRAKILSTINNANLVLELQEQGESISDIVWSFAPAKSKRTSPANSFEWRATSPESDQLSKHLKKLGFGFVGSTTMYALMQATGFVNDHAPGCYRRKELS
jgi:DNA-3-methyladenine glycosylase I